MHISHVIRGDEWISSTPRHILIYDAFGWKPPSFAHVPVILSQSGGKLSKRHGATTVREFRDKGYLKEAIINFIALLGWSYDDKTDLFNMNELIEYFTLERINKSPAVFSYEKLDWYNGVYLRNKSPDELFSLIIPFLLRSGLLSEEKIKEYRPYIISIIPLIKERIKHLSDAPEQMWFFFDETFDIREKKLLIPKKLGKEDARVILETSLETLSHIDPFDKSHIEERLRDLAEKLPYKIGQLFMPLRVAVTGTHASPGLFETMEVLGKNRVLQRINNALAVIENFHINKED